MLDVTVEKRFADFSLSVAFRTEEQSIVLFGPSGAGKSLTLQAIAGTLRPDAGRIMLQGQPVYDSTQRLSRPPQARRIGYVPQHYALFPHLSAADNIGFGLQRLSRRERRRRVEELLDLFQLGSIARQRPRELSGGQQQRVALARALAPQPRVLLLDEPFAALDGPLRGTLRQELVEVQRRWEVALLVVTHDVADAFTFGHTVLVYDRGRIIQQGTRDAVFFRPATLRVAELVGTRNVLPAVVEACDAHTLWVRWNGHRIAAPPAALTPGAPVFLCIRPTQILMVRPEHPPERVRDNLLAGTIVSQYMQAETYTLQFRVNGDAAPAELEILLPAYVYHRLELTVGKALQIALRKQDLHVLARAEEQTIQKTHNFIPALD